MAAGLALSGGCLLLIDLAPENIVCEEGAGDCPEAYNCIGSSCVVSCQDGDCFDGYACDLTINTCFESCYGVGNNACDDDSFCCTKEMFEKDFCAQSEYADGICLTSCEPGARCGEDYFICNAAGVCPTSCSDNDDCVTDRVCNDGACKQPCGSDDECADGFACGSVLDFCLDTCSSGSHCQDGYSCCETLIDAGEYGCEQYTCFVP